MIPIDKEDFPVSFSLESQNSGSEIPGAVSVLQAVQVHAVVWYWVGEKESN